MRHLLCMVSMTTLLGRHLTANTRGWPDAGLLLGQRRRRWTHIKPTFAERILFTVFKPYFPIKGGGPGAVVKVGCLANRRSQLRAPLWPLS